MCVYIEFDACFRFYGDITIAGFRYTWFMLGKLFENCLGYV